VLAHSGAGSVIRLAGALLGPQSVTVGGGVTVITRADTEGLAAEVDACAGRTYRAIGATAARSAMFSSRYVRARYAPAGAPKGAKLGAYYGQHTTLGVCRR
jgi:hypothetical protein